MTPNINQLRTLVANMRERAINGSRRVPRGNDFESGYETGQISACDLFLQMLDDKHEPEAPRELTTSDILLQNYVERGMYEDKTPAQMSSITGIPARTILDMMIIHQYKSIRTPEHEPPDVDQKEPATVWPDSPVDYERDVR